MLDKLLLVISGIGVILLDVKGKVLYVGGVLEQGCNVLYELLYQILQMCDLFKLEIGLKVNWIVVQVGINCNVILVVVSVQVDVWLLCVVDVDKFEEIVNECIKNKLILDMQVLVKFECCCLLLEVMLVLCVLVEYVQKIYGEFGKMLEIDDKVEGGGIDVVFVVLKIKVFVIECFGLVSFGVYLNDVEYVDLNFIVLCLYLLMCMVMDVLCDCVGLVR